jgi:hypothetical protein
MHAGSETIFDRELDGRNHNLIESDDVLRVLLRAEDGRSIKYAYRGFRFTVERRGFIWWCHGGYSRPGSLIAMEHEGGWASLTHRSIVRKLTRNIQEDERRRGRRYEAGDGWW